MTQEKENPAAGTAGEVHNHSAGNNSIPVSNGEFLQAIFGEDWRTAHVNSVEGDPLDCDRWEWCGRRYLEYEPPEDLSDILGNAIDDPTANNYFTISLFEYDHEQHRAARRKDLFRACHLVAVDDVGPKVKRETLASMGFPEPTYRLETSPGNEQWGYVFDTPVTTRIHIEHLLGQWVQQGITCDGKDPGMKGVTRYVRLPVGSNCKAIYGQPFRHVLRSWLPWLCYPIEDLADMTGVDLSKAKDNTRRTRGKVLPEGRDPILRALVKEGLDPRCTKEKFYEIECPWIDEHSHRADSGAAYIQPGGFKCHHGACEKRKGKDLKQWLKDRGHEVRPTGADLFGGQDNG